VVGIADIGAGSDVTFNHLTFTGGVGPNGGAIASAGGLTILNSTLSGNSSAGGGGAIGALGGWLQIRNSTVSGNTAPDQGGAIRTVVPTALVNVTVTANAGSYAIAYSGLLSLKNSIVAGNATGDLVDEGGTLLIFGSNFLGGDPKLGPLQDNGGPTSTHLPLAGSPALDGGDNTAAAAAGLSTDQRGVARALPRPGAPTARVDIGAAEAIQPVAIRVTITP
jgi:polymorphic membrane protein